MTTQVQRSGFTPAHWTAGEVQWLFAELLTVTCGFFMTLLRSIGMNNGSRLQVEPLNPDLIGKPGNLHSYDKSLYVFYL